MREKKEPKKPKGGGSSGPSKFDEEGYPSLPPQLLLRAEGVASRLNFSLRLFEAPQIEKIATKVAADCGVRPRAVLNVMQATSNFGRPESLHNLNALLLEKIRQGYTVYAPGKATLPDALLYLSSHKTFFGEEEAIPKTVPASLDSTEARSPVSTSVGDKTVILLDYTIIHLMATDPDFALRIIRSKDVLMIDPVGLCDGLSLFTISGPRSLEEKTRVLVELVNPRSLRTPHAVEEFFSDRTRDLVRRALLEGGGGVPLPSTALDIIPMTGDLLLQVSPDQSKSPAQRIADNLNPGPISADYIAKHVFAQSGGQPDIQEALLSCIEASTYLSPRVMVSRLRELAGKLADIPSTHFIDQRDIVFLIPESGRSHDLMTFALRVVMGAFENPCLNIQELRRCKQEKDPMPFGEGHRKFVVVDDLAISGTTARKNWGMMREVIFRRYPVVLAYVAATNRAFSGGSSDISPDDPTSPLTGRIRSLAEEQADDPNFAFIAVQPLAPLRELPQFQSLSLEMQQGVLERLGALGYGGLGVCAAPWYMIPNTCPRFIAEKIFPAFCPITALRDIKLRQGDFISFRNTILGWVTRVIAGEGIESVESLKPLVDSIRQLRKAAERHPAFLDKEMRRVLALVEWYYDELKKERER